MSTKSRSQPEHVRMVKESERSEKEDEGKGNRRENEGYTYVRLEHARQWIGVPAKRQEEIEERERKGGKRGGKGREG